MALSDTMGIPMPEFTFTASAECRRCGKYLSSSTEDCDNCDSYEEQRWHFIHLSEDRTEVVWAINPVRAWKTLGDIVGRDNVLPWKLHETGAMSLHYKQMGYDVTDEDELRQSSLAKR